MGIKSSGSKKSILTPFDLLGNDEVALTKAFAYLLGKEFNVFREFLNFIIPKNANGVKQRITKKLFKEAEIYTEKTNDKGRTDIEIKIGNNFHIILEAKIGKNKIVHQINQYNTTFNQRSENKLLVLTTQEKETISNLDPNVKVVKTSWFEICELFNKNKFTDNILVQDFLKFIMRNYRMNNQKEILVQDLSVNNEINCFKNHNIYRRDQTYGTPLYFAPYFTRKAGQDEGEGISYLSKILGILTFIPAQHGNIDTDLERFSDNEEVRCRWVRGVDFTTETITTYYFLDNPVKLRKPLLKDNANTTNWLSPTIPKNRCVTFEEFVRRMNS